MTETRTPYITAVGPVWTVVETCPTCGDYGRIGRHAGQTVYCDCRAGICAELEDRDRVLSILAEQIEAAPEFEKDYRHALWVHFQTLRDEYDQIERALLEPITGGS